MVPAESYETFAEAVLKKLIVEIAGPDTPTGTTLAAADGRGAGAERD
jgi:hypothetical protein